MSNSSNFRQSNALFGGLTILISGDFRQMLPVVPRGTLADEQNACLKSSSFWPSARQMKLRSNMRARLTGDGNAGQFAATLLRIGNGNVLAVLPGGGIALPCGEID